MPNCSPVSMHRAPAPCPKPTPLGPYLFYWSRISNKKLLNKLVLFSRRTCARGRPCSRASFRALRSWLSPGACCTWLRKERGSNAFEVLARIKICACPCSLTALEADLVVLESARHLLLRGVDGAVALGALGCRGDLERHLFV